MTLDAAVRAALDADAPVTIDITTTGRRTGEPRRIEIWFVNVAGSIYIAGTPGPRDWLANLRADSRLVVHLKGDVVADLDATATEITHSAERIGVFEAAETAWYRGQVPFEELVAHAPLVRISFD